MSGTGQHRAASGSIGRQRAAAGGSGRQRAAAGGIGRQRAASGGIGVDCLGRLFGNGWRRVTSLF